MKKNFINEFKNKTILVSGSNGLLGKKLVKTLLKLNSNIIALDLKLPKKKINNKNIIYRACDVTDFKNVEKVTKELRKKKMKLNGLVVAHQYKPQGFLADHNLSKINKYRLWNLVIQSNLTAVYIMLNEFQKLMSKNSSIVVLGSTYGDVSSNPNLYLDNEMGNPAVYSASKAGAAMLARYYGVHLAKKKIRVNVFTPHGIKDKHSKNFQKKFSSLSPIGRLMSTDEACEPIIFLLSNKSSYCIASELKADGGWVAW